MDINITTTLSVSVIYVAILGLVFVPMTIYVGIYRVKHQIDIGDAGDKAMLRRIRGQANFIEQVPLAVVLLVCMELMGASNALLHGLGITLVLARISHYLGLTRIGPFLARPAGMVGTFAVYIISAVWILMSVLTHTPFE